MNSSSVFRSLKALLDVRVAVAFTALSLAAMLASPSSLVLAQEGNTDGEGELSDGLPINDYERRALLSVEEPYFIAGVGTAVGGALGGGAGGSIRGAVLRSAPIYDATADKAESFELIAKIIRNAEQVSSYRAGELVTVFWPTNESLVRVLGAERVSALQQSANQASAKQFLQALTVRGSYNLEALKAAAKSGQVLQTLLGQGLQLSLSGDTLLINGVPVLNTEYPASNGWVLATDGIIVRDDAEGTAAQSK